ncbi:MAG: sugar ABC transporter permease [Candidatus Sumerlaeia bacterium]|nr:sugar ABC transporter permease [Candidatus Sumerlaeia bacterium]
MVTATQRKVRESLTAYAYLAPAAVVLITFWFLPVIVSLAMSFFNLTALSPLDEASFVGVANFKRALNSEQFQRSLWNTVNYAVYSVPLTLFFSLMAALLLNSKVKGIAVWRTVFFLPYITTWVAISIVWMYIYHKNYGLANFFLQTVSVDLLGLESPWKLQWLDEDRGIWEMLFGFKVSNWPFAMDELVSGPSLALFSIIITSVWRDIGYFMIIFLAGLQNIDKTYYEAADIDGASPWTQFWHITFPLLSPVSFFLLVISLIGAFQVFVPMLVMTPNGGINYSTAPMVFYIYDSGFRGNWELSYASAIAYLLTGMILTLTIIQNKVLGKKVVYQ